MNKKIKVFEYDGDHDVFVVSQAYREISEQLGLAEWNPVVWIGRLFTMDNDVGEHWFDNWGLREARGVGFEEALIIDPDRFQDGRDGPCHSADFRKRFWTDVLSSLELSLDLMFDEAREFQKAAMETARAYPNDVDYRATVIADIDERIDKIKSKYGCTTRHG